MPVFAAQGEKISMLPVANWPIKRAIDTLFRPFTKFFLHLIKPVIRDRVCNSLIFYNKPCLLSLSQSFSRQAERFTIPSASKLKIITMKRIIGLFLLAAL